MTMEFLHRPNEDPQPYVYADRNVCNFWNLVLPIAASLIGGALSNKGSKDAAQAQQQSADAATNLQRDIYTDTRNLNRPGYMTGGAASNILANQYGIAPQNYQQAYDSPSQPVGMAPPTGNGLTNLLNRGQPASPNYASADPSYDWDNYYSSNPDLGGDAGWGNANIRAQFGDDRNAFLQAHWHDSGQREGRTLNSLAPTAAGASGANGLTANPMDAFMASPDGQIATSGFRGVDTPEIAAAFSRGGKYLSGAQSIALDERGKARLGNAYGNYTNGLRSLAGQAQTSIGNVGNAGQSYATNAGNTIMAAGQAKADGLASGYNGLMQGVGGALGALKDYGRSQWGWV